MSDNTKQTADSATGRMPAQPVRLDFLPKEDYVSLELLTLEKARLFPRAGQIACRLEEIPNAGDLVTCDTGDDSVIVPHTYAAVVKANFNVRQHRGRQLEEGNGNTGDIVKYPFHGWRFKLRRLLAAIFEAKAPGGGLFRTFGEIA